MTGLSAAVAAMGALEARPSPANADDEYEEDDNAVDSSLPQFDGSGRLVDSPTSTYDATIKANLAPTFELREEQGATYETPSTWQLSTEGGYRADAVTGKVVNQITIGSQTSEGLTSVTDLGRVEELPTKITKVLPLSADLSKADLLGAAKRTKDGAVYYDLDLVLSPAKCDQAGSIVKGTCLPDRLVLLSAAVVGDHLTVFRLDASPEQYRLSAKAIKAVRESFTVLS